MKKIKIEADLELNGKRYEITASNTKFLRAEKGFVYTNKLVLRHIAEINENNKRYIPNAIRIRKPDAKLKRELILEATKLIREMVFSEVPR